MDAAICFALPAAGDNRNGVLPVTPPNYTLCNCYGELTNGRELWPAWFEFLSCPWFSRAWVIQEIVMAKEVHIEAG